MLGLFQQRGDDAVAAVHQGFVDQRQARCVG